MTMLSKISSNLIMIFIFFEIIFFSKEISAEVIVLDRIYIIVNSQMLTQSEALDYMKSLQSQTSSTIKSKEKFHKKFLMSIVQDLLLLDRANALKINPSNNEIENRLEKLSKQQPKILDVYSEEELREQISMEFKKHRVINREIGSKIHLESDEIVKHCKKQIRKNRQIELFQIILNGSKGEIQEKVANIIQDFNIGIKFNELARINSIDPKAKINGGRLGIFKSTDLLPKIGEIVSNLKKGEISNLVETSMGNHLFYIEKEILDENVNCENLDEENNSKYSNSLYNHKRNLLLKEFMDDLYFCADIEIKGTNSSELPNSEFLPVVEKNNVNCQNKRSMILPKKKEKTTPKRKS